MAFTGFESNPFKPTLNVGGQLLSCKTFLKRIISTQIVFNKFVF